MVQSLLSNFAVIFLLHIIVERLESSRSNKNNGWIDALVVIAISFSVISMYYLPITFEGYHFDLRFIPLLFAALIRPRKITLIILLITVFFRWIMGGDGAIPGMVFGLIFPTLFTMLFRIKEYSKGKLLPILLICSVDWMMSDIPAIFILPNGWQVFTEMALIRYISFLLATTALFFLIYNAKKRLLLETKLRYESSHDQLTGVWNKKTMLASIKQRMEQRDHAYIAMIDVDYFKQVNDQFGHMTGDKVLQEIAGYLRDANSSQAYSDVARYGGEEFIYYLEVDTLHEALTHFDKVRNRIRMTQFYSVKEEPIITITISIGISRIENMDTIDRALEKADQLVYQAKSSGRDCIIYE